MTTQTATKKNYSEKLKDPKWQRLRLRVFERDNWKCRFCGDEKSTLHVHHLKYTAKEPHHEPEENLITYCEDCHAVVELFKRESKKVSVIKICKVERPDKSKKLVVAINDTGSINFFEVDNSGALTHVIGFTRDRFNGIIHFYNG